MKKYLMEIRLNAILLVSLTFLFCGFLSSLFISQSLPFSSSLPSQVRVVIVDENDCVPEFLQSIYSKDGVPETVTTATSLLQGETYWQN